MSREAVQAIVDELREKRHHGEVSDSDVWLAERCRDAAFPPEITVTNETPTPPTALDFTDYQDFVRENWAHRRNPAREAEPGDPLRQLYIMSTGLAGEVGEVLELLKKHVRDGTPRDPDKLRLELGDVLYYLTAIANWTGLDLADIAEGNRAKLLQRRAWGGKHPPGEGPLELWCVYAEHEGRHVALTDYLGRTKIETIRKVMDKARSEGYHGPFDERMRELGWALRRLSAVRADPSTPPLGHPPGPNSPPRPPPIEAG